LRCEVRCCHFGGPTRPCPTYYLHSFRSLTFKDAREHFDTSQHSISAAKKVCLVYLVDIAEKLSSDVLPSGLLVGNDTVRGREDDESKRSGGEEQVDPRLDLVDLDVESGRDDSRLVESTVELNDDLAGSVVVNDLELSDVAWTRESARLSATAVRQNKSCWSSARWSKK
jgi:hypothetical protein